MSLPTSSPEPPTPEPSTPAPGPSRFLRACLRQPVDRTPVWFLRQAGRYMPEYMAVRRHHSLLDICRTPDIAAEVTITAAERLGVDAAIIFADLLLPFTPMGVDFEFVNGEGPVVRHPIRTLEQIQALRTDRTGDLLYVAQAIEKVARHFTNPRPDGDTLGIIGFCGAPFTLASYMIEGGSSRNYIETKKLMYASGAPSSPDARHPERSAQRAAEEPALSPSKGRRETQPHHDRPNLSPTDAFTLTHPDDRHPEPGAPSSPAASSPAKVGSTPTTAWPLLMSKLVDVLFAYAQQQVEAGADVIQVFDSWAGALSVSDYRQFCLGPTTELIQRIRSLGVPVIYFGVDTASLLPTFRETGADVLGLDWRIPLNEGWRATGSGTAVQGNLDPITLFGPPDVIEARVREILAQAAGRPGHIFNLGHGIAPGTPVESVLQVVDLIRKHGATPAAREATSEWAIRA